ncbi:histone acetyltransferase HPA2 [Pseudomonas sp. LRF_L74]|uniref:DUF7931 domain-containing protein n=1 Tax=Pseudomonas sp. LRF_L74 TaxID=3369422 RepID=UPI003F621C63
MNDDKQEVDLPAIDFQSPGRFAVLNPGSEAIAPQNREPAPFQLGRHPHLERFQSAEQCQPHVLALIQQARHSLCLYSSDLEPLLYDHSSIQEACTGFLLAHPRNRLRILVRDVSKPVKQGHRLLSLAKRITSNLHIRRINDGSEEEQSTYLLADDCGLLLRAKPESYVGYALYNDSSRARRQRVAFDQAWETGLQDPDLRSFLL